jgi:DNA-binding NarL/FixJ family response regulator
MVAEAAMRVLVVDDQRLFREGFCSLLRASGQVESADPAADAREAYALVPRVRPDVVTVELVLSGVDGVTAAREIRRLSPGSRVVLLTGCKDRRPLRTAWLSGIDACLTKDDTMGTVLAAFASVMAGSRYLAPALRRAGAAPDVLGELACIATDPLARLSRRERVVFDLVVRGFSTKEVARELCISTKTVETHRAHINEKLAVHCTADLVRFAFRDSSPFPLGWGTNDNVPDPPKRGRGAGGRGRRLD